MCGSGSGSADSCLWLMDPVSDSDLDPGSRSYYFRHWPSRCQQKTNFFKKCLLLFEGTFTLFYKDKKSKRSLKTVGIKVFLTIFACWSGIREAQKHVDPVDLYPDPEHCEGVFLTVKNIASGEDYQWREWRRGGRWWWRARWRVARSPSRSRRCSRRRPPRRRSAPAPSWSGTQYPPPAGNSSQYLHRCYHKKNCEKILTGGQMLYNYMLWFWSYFDQKAHSETKCTFFSSISEMTYFVSFNLLWSNYVVFPPKHVQFFNLKTGLTSGPLGRNTQIYSPWSQIV